MKPPSDIARPGFEPRCYRYVDNLATTKAIDAPVVVVVEVVVVVVMIVDVTLHCHQTTT